MKENHERITKEFCQGKILAFFPKAEGEARLIEQMFSEMGYRWAEKDAKASSCVYAGMYLEDEHLHTYAQYHLNKANAYLCTVEQFSENYISLAESFNTLSRRIDDIEKKMDMICTEINPVRMDKGGLKKPEPGNT